MLENITDIFQDRAQEDGKTLEVSLDFRESHVLGDEKKISQIVNNLLSNAIKYSEAGDRIRLEARQFDFQEHSKYQIVVEDTGIGMSESFLEHLFEPYSRESLMAVRKRTMDRAPTIPRERAMLLPSTTITDVVISVRASSDTLNFLL